MCNPMGGPGQMGRELWCNELYLAKSNAINLLCQPLVIEGTPAEDYAGYCIMLLHGPVTGPTG